MMWTVEFDDAAARELRKLDRKVQQEILRYLRERIATEENPCRFGKPLTRELAGLWRYRVRDYRVICHIEDYKLVVFVVRVAHRKNVYE
ncbi:MAG: type II toxin-antitoxin system RelE/ParE family toxin [Gammaproteobacteria bacterium]|nr:type II toxin-antitoxin system RelE/ParE family toxin [Gammaproteobacteria bacterium]